MAERTLRRAGLGALWYVLPALAVVGVAAYVVGALVWHANPPAVPVTGVSMRPTLERGDLVFLKGVAPSKLRKGDIIAFHVPKSSQSQYGLPGELVHRIIKVQPSPAGLIFQTKGDANSGPDVFVIHSGDVVGELVGKAPGLGFPLLFFRSRQGEILLGAAGLVALIYFLIGLYEERRVYVEGTALGMQTVLAETHELRQMLLATAGGGSPTASAVAPVVEVRHDLGELQEEVRRVRERGEETTETMRQLVGAVGEYGTHLRSHTAVMQNLAATTAELHRATAELGSTVAEPAFRRQVAPAVEPPPRAATGARLAGGRLESFPVLPLGVPVDLLQQRAALDARAARVDELLRRLSVGPSARLPG